MKGADGVALVKMAGTPVELADGAVLPIHEALYLTGSMPAHGIVEAVPADVAIEGREVLAAYEIRIYANEHQQSRGRTWKPADGKVQAHLDPAAVGSPAPDVFRFADASAAPERLDTETDENGWIVFDVDGASIYAVAREAGKTLSAGGEGWKVTVTDLSGTCIPDGAELLVEEVPADAYLADTAAVLGWSPDDTVYYNRYLNIRLTLDGGEITLPSPVEVSVDLPDAGESADALEAVRFTGEDARKLDGASATGGTVSFAADAFGTFGFGAALRTSLTWTDEAAAYSLQAFGALPDPACEVMEIGAETGLEEGLEAIAAYRVSSGAEADGLMKLWVKISTNRTLNSRESVAVYGMSDSQAGNLLGETAADSLVVPVEDRGGFALALDSGYRRKHIESEGMTLDGMMPKAAEAAAEDVTGQAAEAYPALENGGDEQVLAAWRIDLTEGGETYLPDEAHPISMALAATLAEGMEALRLWRIDEIGVPAEETAFDFDGETVRFTAGASAVYAVTGVLEKTVIAFEGSRYRVTVAYGPGAGVPEGASLESAEIDYEEDTETFLRYAGMASAALGRNALEGYMRLFDLRIVDEAGQKVEPLTPVTVRMELTDLDEAISPNVIHFADGSETGEVLSAVPGGDRKSADCVLTFATGGFSVYAIVDAPAPIVIEKTVTSLDQLAEGVAYTLSYNGNHFATSTLNNKDAFVETSSESGAASWYFEPADDSGQRFYIYTLIDSEKQYITNPSDVKAGLSPTEKATFELSSTGNDKKFWFKLSGENKWLQHSNGGGGIRFYGQNNDVANSRIVIRRVSTALPDDAYGLDGKTFGIAYHNESVTAAAVMATEKTVNGQQRLAGQDMLMRPDVLNHDGMLLVAQGSDITEWTFVIDHEDQYRLSTVVDGSTRYLVVNGANVTLTEDPEEASLIKVTPGTGTNAGKWRFTSNGYALNLVNNADGGFNGSTSTGAATWLNLVSRSVLDDDDFTLYSARKASVSDDEMVYDRTVDGVREQSQIVLYTRVWNEDTERYDFYAVDHDGSLVKCYDSGDCIEWIGTKVNTAAWNFTEYKNPDGTPSYYYELQNDQYGSYLVPHSADGKILSDTPVGINLNGRRYGENDTSVIAWDDESYAYSGLKVEDGRVVACPLEEAEEFYVAVIEYIDTEVPPLTTARTIDNNAYGITMKMIDFNNRIVNNRDSFFGSNNSNKYDPGLLTTNLIGDYPYTTSKTGHTVSLGNLFNNMQPVNHLFLQSIHSESGYFEYDSTQHFAHLNGDGNFTVYDQIAQVGNDNGDTRAHGQFMPYNNLDPDIISTVVNRTDVMANELPDSNPRKGERLYSIPTNMADYFFGMEMEASFTQTASGLDAWGHDIIFEFSGDDDFWLYVDGELVLDLGGTRPAMSGSINFRTGEVRFGGTRTTLIDVFRSNYQARGLSESEIERLLDEKFEQNDAGQYVFTDYTNHTMKMFYMERGAGASNLHMRFNLAAVRPGTFLLSKKLSGTDNPNNQLLEFPYQIYYKREGDDEYRLLEERDAVKYEGTKRKVTYKSTYRPAGGTVRYQHVFFLKSGQSAEVTLPDETASYYVKECAILPNVYDQVTVNGTEVAGTPTANMAGGVARNDYTIEPDTLENRSRVAYDNHVTEGAMRTLNVRKELYDTDGLTELQYPDNRTTFRFRLYLGTENDDPSELPSADQYTYYIKNTQNEYCRWNRSLQQFESLDITDYDDLSAYMAGLSAAGREAIAFKTSMYGTISNVPAGYSVEVRDLIVGTQWKIEERTEELPRGYTRREADGYVRLDTHDSQTDPISGTMQADDLPRVEIRNQKGWGLTVRKVWTDQDFMESHDPVYFAVYLPGVSDPLKGSVRRLMSGETEIYYFFDDLKYIMDGETTPSTFSFSDFTIREVTLHPSHGLEVDSNGVVTIPHNVTVKPIINDDTHDGTLHIGGTPVGGSHQSNYKYTVSYQQGTSTGQNENIRTDTVTNSRPGISLYKQEMNGQNLSGAVFTLKDSDGHDVAAAEYTSDSTGLITRAYLSAGTYVLTETATPKGYVALPEPLTITVHHNHTVTISGNPELCQLKDVPDADMIATVIVRNRANAFLVKKVDADQSNAPMAGVHFALYQQVTDQNNNKRKDYQPMPGYEDLTTDVNGVLPQISMTDLKAGTYYLTETQTLDGYAIIEEDVVFTLGVGGTVTVDAPHSGWLHENTDSDGSVNYEIVIPNGRMKPVQLKKLVTGNMAERSDEFTFTIQVSRNGQPVKFQVGETEHQGQAVITLTHDLPVTLYLPVGANVQITEDPLDYTLLRAEGATNGALSGHTYTLTVAEEDSGKTITFTNQKTQIIDTGVRTSDAPYGAVLVLDLLYGIWILRRRRRCAR